jgi:anti-sigma factor RsiW
MSEDEIIVEVSDYLDGTLKGLDKDAVETKIASDPEYKRVHDEMIETKKALSGLQKARAPSTFAQDVTSTIHKRSAGRFFGRRSFGDRVPFSALVVIAVLGLLAIAYFLWASQTGSLK